MSDRGSALGQDAARVHAEVAALVARARTAQRAIDGCDQARADELAVAAAWAIVEPSRNRALAELAVRDTGMGDVADKFAKNRRKTMGLLRDLAGNFAAVRDHTAIADPSRVVVHLSHVLVDPARRRASIGDQPLDRLRVQAFPTL